MPRPSTPTPQPALAPFPGVAAGQFPVLTPPRPAMPGFAALDDANGTRALLGALARGGMRVFADPVGGLKDLVTLVGAINAAHQRAQASRDAVTAGMEAPPLAAPDPRTVYRAGDAFSQRFDRALGIPAGLGGGWVTPYDTAASSSAAPPAR